MRTLIIFTTLLAIMSANAQQGTLQSTTKYDFVPGDQVLYFEDFSQDKIGDFPAHWTSNSSGEVKTLNIAPGHWFHMNGEDASYCYTRKLEFPDNFIIEFDIVPDNEFQDGIMFTLYEDVSDQEFTDDLYPGLRGLHIQIDDEKWESKGYNNESDDDWLTGQSSTATVGKEKVNHVIIWVQKRRLRVYHEGKKAMDVATNIFQGTRFNRFRFSGWDMHGWPFVSNIKITTAAPDTRSKLLTEGKLISYGIYFDSGKDEVKPESYGALNDIATVMKENPDLRVKVVGHTDSDGSDQLNLDLSKRRAENVKKALSGEFGLDAGRIETDGAGESQPLAPNTTVEGKAKNRRVEFIRI
jgi:outer membrane protein OmpA-like peptidoglycan-associated protein